MTIAWTADLDTGIEIIDEQHRKIVDYINQLEVAIRHRDHRVMGQVLQDLVDYTVSHFSFEEELQVAAGYRLASAHKSIHTLFIKRVGKYQARYDAGDDVSGQLHGMLKNWLIHHIKRDDAAYVATVRGNITTLMADTRESGWLGRTLRSIFNSENW